MTLNGVIGKKKVPKFTSRDGRIIAEPQTNDNDYTVKISRSDVSDDSISVDTEMGVTTIRHESRAYRPLFVYKALLKMALSCLPERHVKAYEFAFKSIITDEFDNDLKQFTEIDNYTLQLGYAIDYPIAIVFKKIRPSDTVFTHMFQLQYQNLIFQFVVPLHVLDVIHGQRGTVFQGYYSPPLLSLSLTSIQCNLINITHNTYDLSKTETIKDVTELQLPVSASDEATKKDNPLDYNNIVEVHIKRTV